MSDGSRYFVGSLYYNWATREKRLAPCTEEGLASIHTDEPGFRHYRFSFDLPPPDLGLVAPVKIIELHTHAEEEQSTREWLPKGMGLGTFVVNALSRVVRDLLPGGIYSPNSVRTYFQAPNAIEITTILGKVRLVVEAREFEAEEEQLAMLVVTEEENEEDEGAELVVCWRGETAGAKDETVYGPGEPLVLDPKSFPPGTRVVVTTTRSAEAVFQDKLRGRKTT